MNRPYNPWHAGSASNGRSELLEILREAHESGGDVAAGAHDGRGTLAAHLDHAAVVEGDGVDRVGIRPETGYAQRVDRDEMLRVLEALDAEAVEYVLIGAAAMGVHGIVRATEDLDIVIRAIAENVARLRRALHAVYGADPNIEEISTADLLGEYPAVRYYPPSGDLYLDIMTRLGTAASYDTVEADTKTVAGVRIRVATPRALYDLKKGTVRPLDHQDAAMLRQAFNLKDDGR